MSVRTRSGLLVGIGCAALALALAGCARPVSGPDTTSPPAPTSLATARGHAAVEITIALHRNQAHAGESIAGTATVTNTTGKVLSVDGCPGSWLRVGLTNATVPFDPVFAEERCLPETRLTPGAHTFPVTVGTTYQTCLGPDGHSLAPMPTCDNGKLPPLPSGTYRTKVVTEGLSAPVDAAPVTVTLLY